MITDQGRHDGGADLQNLFFQGDQLGQGGDAAFAVVGMGKLVNVEANLPEMAQEPGELGPFEPISPNDQWSPGQS